MVDVVLQGVLYATSDCIKSVTDSVKLWLHEAARVYKDKFVDDKDMSTYDEMSTDIAKKFFDVGFIVWQYDERYIFNTPCKT